MKKNILFLFSIIFFGDGGCAVNHPEYHRTHNEYCLEQATILHTNGYLDGCHCGFTRPITVTTAQDRTNIINYRDEFSDYADSCYSDIDMSINSQLR